MQSFAQLKEKVNKLLNEKTLIARFQRTDHNSLTNSLNDYYKSALYNETGCKVNSSLFLLRYLLIYNGNIGLHDLILISENPHVIYLHCLWKNSIINSHLTAPVATNSNI